MKISHTLVALAGALVATSSGATTTSWGTAFDIGLTSGSIFCSVTTCQTTATGLSGDIVRLTAYSTPTLSNASGSGSASPADTGTWVSAMIRSYSGSGGGIAITNNVQPYSVETNAPQHAIENRGVNDILVVDFNPNNLADYNQWDVSAFTLGYTCQMTNKTYSNDDPTCTAGGTVNVDAWLGGSGPINFTDGSFAGFTANNVAPGTAGLLPGFTNLTISPDPSGSGVRTVSGTDVGRYLVLTGSISGWKDAFKVTGLAADRVIPPPPGGHDVPAPGSLPLMLAGLAGLAWAGRRKLATAR